MSKGGVWKQHLVVPMPAGEEKSDLEAVFCVCLLMCLPIRHAGMIMDLKLIYHSSSVLRTPFLRFFQRPQRPDERASEY